MKKLGGSVYFLIGITALIITVCLLWYPEQWLWLFFPVGLTTYAIIRTIRQWVSDGRHPNLHYPDVCEGCDPIRMADGSPITDIIKWYAAKYKCTREDAAKALANADKNGNRLFWTQHQHYLKSFR